MRFLKAFVLIFMMFGCIYAQEPAQQIPDFKFITTTGQNFTKANLNKNHKTLIVFFDASCSHCQKAGAYFNSHLKDLNPFNVLFITMDEEKAIQLFMKDYAPLIPEDKNVKILRDTARYFVPNFLPRRYPAMYVYDKSQKLLLYVDDDRKFDEVLDKLRAK
ncbi:MAG TPA: redoxin domain-containing protein [Pelobium sp.]